MASNGPATRTGYLPSDEDYGFEEPLPQAGEWNPTAESVRPVRGRHRVIKQRGGLARSSTVLGVGVIAAVGAGGIATAQGGKPAVQISVPDVAKVTDSLPEAKSLPGVGSLVSGSEEAAADPAAAAPLSTAARGVSPEAGENLRNRILQQAEQQEDAAASAAQQAAEQAAAKKAAEEAAEQQSKAKAEADAKAEAAKKAAEEEARRKAEAERLAKLARSYSLPTSSYTLTSHFGDAGSMWSSGYHTGLDFAAPTGTPVKAVHSGTVKEAGWSGAYGYRTVLELEDGTEIWYCHQSSMSVSVGQQVTTGDVIGRVGSTGNSSGPHLHVEVHTPGGTGIDPLGWLQSKGLNP
ncbi:M23 family metallopeptidase [Streptomyces sp. NA04227]|uniref:M23 family metallopeptidase n=1 Tax=Streptomyces sp. NA04227 TaxID=2742136 RepID=UPI001591B211|nr:M23 family metallopeptidase [Streptomyces sp. NA04227]QKW08121.1 M23 family metallopeptidase [Streptomyces sp. NA04227]